MTPNISILLINYITSIPVDEKKDSVFVFFKIN